MKCYKIVFNKEGQKNNIGSYILLGIIFLIIILTIIFKIKGYNQLKDKINEIIKKKIEELNKDSQNNIDNNRKITKLKANKYSIKNNNRIKNNEEIIDNSYREIMKYSYKKKDLNYNDYELNSLSYCEALEKDKRTFFQYYCSLLRTTHILIFAFYTSSDYNSKLLKIIWFFFSFALYITVNALFFTESTIHKIYVDKGNFNFIYHIPHILYSTIISSIINILIKKLALSEKNILEIKKENENFKEKAKKELKNLIIKFVMFFVICYSLLIFFWYYLSCFCGIYKNTQFHLIIDASISFGLSLLSPFGINLITGIFRFISINLENKSLFFISKLFYYCY